MFDLLWMLPERLWMLPPNAEEETATVKSDAQRIDLKRVMSISPDDLAVVGGGSLGWGLLLGNLDPRSSLPLLRSLVIVQGSCHKSGSHQEASNSLFDSLLVQ